MASSQTLALNLFSPPRQYMWHALLAKKKMTKIGQTWLWQLLKENTAKYWGSPPCTQSQLIPTKSWVQQYPTSPPSFKNGLHPWQGRKLVHAIHDTYYLTKVWVFKISKRAFLLQNLWLLTAQGTFFFPKREGLNISLLILHSHLEFNFWYISCPGATLLQQDYKVYCASPSKL